MEPSDTCASTGSAVYLAALVLRDSLVQRVVHDTTSPLFLQKAESDAKPGDERNEFSMYSFGAQFAEVRVDADLGQVKVSRIVAASPPDAF